jgi:hypothetical protein
MDQQGFVETSNKAWLEATASVILPGVPPGVVNDDGDFSDVLKTGLCQKIGSCYNKMSVDARANFHRILGLLTNVVRSRRGLRDERAPLLVVSSKSGMDDFNDDGQPSQPPTSTLRAYIVCQLNFSPLDMCLWSCQLVAERLSGHCVDTICPKSFTAVLDTVFYTSGSRDDPSSQQSPKLCTMHRLAFQLCDLPFEDLLWKVVTDYHVASLRSVYVKNISVFCTPAEVEEAAVAVAERDTYDDPAPDVSDVSSAVKLLFKAAQHNQPECGAAPAAGSRSTNSSRTVPAAGSRHNGAKPPLGLPILVCGVSFVVVDSRLCNYLTTMLKRNGFGWFLHVVVLLTVWATSMVCCCISRGCKRLTLQNVTRLVAIIWYRVVACGLACMIVSVSCLYIAV